MFVLETRKGGFVGSVLDQHGVPSNTHDLWGAVGAHGVRNGRRIDGWFA